VSGASNSAGAKGQAIRKHARRGVWRPILSAMGVTAHTRTADAQAARWNLGGEYEALTARMLAPLAAEGWQILHDRRLPSGANLDHLLVVPSASVLVALDTKRWHAQREATLIRGRVHCGSEDRHDQVEKVARYAATVAGQLRVPVDAVVPLLVVHGSRIPGKFLAAPVPRRVTPVYVLQPTWLLSTLRGAAAKAGPPNPTAALQLACRAAARFPEYKDD